jgi:anti-sigma factor RsiW
MKCYDESILQRLVDGELGALFGGRVASHLKKCRRCRDGVDGLSGENSEISRLFREDIKVPELRQPIMDKIRTARDQSRHPEKSRSRLLVRGLQIAAAIFLVALFLVFLFQDRNPGPFNGERDILIRTASVEGQAVQTHVFVSGDPDTKFIWLEKM